MVTTLVPPRIGTVRNPERPTIGDYYARIGCELGYEFHAWQALLSDISGELIPRPNATDGQSSLRMNAQYVGALVGRQTGKTAWCASRIVAQCLLPDYPDIAALCGMDTIRPQHVAYTSQNRNAAALKWNEHVAIIESSPTIKPLIRKAYYALGRERLEFYNGSTYRPITPNRTGARGLALDLVIVDEALTHPAWLLPVLLPTMAQRDGAIGCIGAQFVVISNAGDDDSELLNRMQELGQKAINDPDARRVWLEWSAPNDCDPLAESTWRATIPTLDQPNGIAMDFLRMEAETLRLDQFMREYLCVRVPKSRVQLIPTDRWMELYRTDVIVPADLCFGLDVRPRNMPATLTTFDVSVTICVERPTKWRPIGDAMIRFTRMGNNNFAIGTISLIASPAHWSMPMAMIRQRKRRWRCIARRRLTLSVSHW